MVNVRDARCLLPVALQCLRYRNKQEKHNGAQRGGLSALRVHVCAIMIA
jgi:hypothetical protein